VVEPWPARQGKHITSDDDPERGRLHRPAHLQLCLYCNRLRGATTTRDGDLGYDNLCDCDSKLWDRDPQPRYGDLSNDRWLCMSCVSSVVAGGTRWSSFYCDDCRPAVLALRAAAGRSVIPVGYHSLMNGTSSQSTDAAEMTSAQATAFHDQLQTLHANQDQLHHLSHKRTSTQAARLGFVGHAVLVDEYTAACAATGHSPFVGFSELIAELGGDDIGTAEIGQLWATTHPPSRR
jgi:hypothetical protein